MKRISVVTAVLTLSMAAFGAPLMPTIGGHDLSFGAYNQDQTIEYETNGTQPDTLAYTRNDVDHEVAAYWPNWPNPPVIPVWDIFGMPNFGGDFVLGVQFTGQDAPYVGPGGVLDVSLTGTGLNTDPGAADLEVYGTIIFDAQTTWNGLLWAIDLEDVSLYGYGGEDKYVLEGIGTVVGGAIADHFNLIGQAGAMRGHLDFFGGPPDWIPELYHPSEHRDDSVRAAYSGETGWIPEPAPVVLLLAGLGLLRRR